MSLKISTICFALLLVFVQVHSISVKFYEDYNTTGYYNEVTSVSDDCTQVPYESTPANGSIKTDTCIMVFLNSNCHGYSSKIVKGTQNINTELFHLSDFTLRTRIDMETFGVKSFHPCNMTEGGPSLNIDIYYFANKILEFKDMCGCRTLPKELFRKGAPLLAHNHGNPFKVYTEQDCMGDSRIIPAGWTDESRALTRFGEVWSPERGKMIPNDVTIKSIGPYRNSHSYLDHCVKLSSSVFKFEFLDSSSEDEMIFEQDVEMASKTVFRNNGTAKITQVYQVTKIVKETAEISTSSSLSMVHKASVDLHWETEGEAGVPFVAKSKIKAGIKLAYEFDRTTTDEESKKTVAEESTEFMVSQTIEIPSCVEYSLSSFVKMLKDKPIEYKVYSKISGELAGNKMTAKQLREHVGDAMEVLRDFDEYTVVTSVKAVMKVNYGVRTFVSGEGNKIVGCVEKKKRKVEK